MDNIYNEHYYKNYDVGIDSVDYRSSDYTNLFLHNVAKSIAALRPKTVLDVGCAMGHLVDGLRTEGIDAYGIDLSEYAISQVPEQIRPYCAVCSVTDELPEHFPQRFDLVVTIEVLEHIPPEDAPVAVSHLCKWGDTILFSSTPDDFDDPTHVNVRPREYWANLFAQNQFYDDVECSPSFITWYSMCFRRGLDSQDMIDRYERGIRSLQEHHQAELTQIAPPVISSQLFWTTPTSSMSEQNSHTFSHEIQAGEVYFELQLPEDIVSLRFDPYPGACLVKNLRVWCQSGALIPIPVNGTTIGEFTLFLEDDPQYTLQLNGCKVSHIHISASISPLRFSDEIALLTLLSKQSSSLQQQLHFYQNLYHVAISQRDELKVQLTQVEHAYHTTTTAFCWKMTKPLRACLDWVKRPLRKITFLLLLRKGLRCWRENGTSYTLRKLKQKLLRRQTYRTVATRPLFTPQELLEQTKRTFPRDITFSIVVPLYNTPPQFLHEMIRSVLDQTYAKWQLCLADGSDAEHAEVEEICRSYAQKDRRICYQKLERNLGISGNTNACLDMATGDYIGLFDHDDLLHPAALYEVMRTICKTNADFIYTDENTFHNTPEDAFCPHFKPDFSPDTLRSYNYICHFTVFARELMEQAGGGFRSEYDGSQDYDLILRLTEQANRVEHIPEILYYWRAHANSVADNLEAKPYTLDAARKALSAHLDRMGLSGEVLDSAVPSTYRIRYDIEGEPLVSIIIPNKDHVETLQTCIRSILSKSTYSNYEIIIVENNSTEPSTFQYYQELEQDPRVKVVVWEGPFNYSAINNYGISQAAQGEYYLLLNNDVEILTPQWLEEMLMFAQRRDVGAVGAMLYYPDDTIQHAGVILGIGGVAGHSHKYFPRNSFGYMSRASIAQNLSAVTAACILIPKRVWEEVHGLDEGFQVAFNDVDLCMRIRKAGHLIVWTPYAELYHYESKSRGMEDTLEKQKRFAGEIHRFHSRWDRELASGDPYYNPNLTLDREDFSIK